MRGPLTRWQGAAAFVAASTLIISSCGSGSAKARSTTVPQAGPTATVRFGFIGALSGPLGDVGAQILNGEKLAVSQFDAVDPPVKVALYSVDTAGDLQRARSGAARLVADRVVALVGPTSGDEASVADPIFEQAGIPNITVSAAGTNLAARGWRFFHRVIPDDSIEGQADGSLLVKELHVTDVAFVDDSSALSRELSVATEESLTAAGGKVLSSDHLGGRPGDLASVVARVVAESPDAVFFSGGAGTAALLVRALRAAGYPGKYLAGGSDLSGFLSAAGPPAAEGSYLTCGCAGTAENPKAQAFNAAYLGEFGSNPGFWSAEAYDATNAVLQAIKSGDMTAAAINQFLGTVDYSGITRTVKFMPDGDWAGDTVYLYKVESGQLVQVATSSQS
jgi:branched-chain amino acid transport system substrate-binding protein